MPEVLSAEPADSAAGRIAASRATGSVRTTSPPSDDSQEPVAILGTNSPATPPASIVIGRHQGTVVVTVHGELDLPRAAHLGATLADLIDGQGNLSVVVDLHGATATDADCLWVFTEAAERARGRGGTITLSDPPGPIHAALHLRGLDNFVRAFVANGGM